MENTAKTDQDNSYELSPQQKRICSLDAIDDKFSSRSNHTFWRVEEKLNFQELQKAIGIMCDKYEILRTRYCQPTGLAQPFQVIMDNSSVELHEVNHKSISEAMNGIEHYSRRNFERNDPINIRIYVHRLNKNIEELTYIQVTSSILSLDLPGMWSLVNQMMLAYKGLEICDEEVVQFVDVANWLSELKKSDDTLGEREYWEKFSEIELGPELKIYENRSRKEGYIQRSVKLSSRVSSDIHSIAETYGIESKSILFSCWQYVLATYAQWESLTLGVSLQDRAEDLENLIGISSSYFPVTSNIGRQKTIIENIKDNDRLINSHSEYKEFFNWEESSDTKAFQMSRFGFDYYNVGEIFANSSELELVDHTSVIDCFDMRLSCLSKKGNYELIFMFKEGLLEDSLDHVIERFERCIHQLVCSDKQTLISNWQNLDILGPNERIEFEAQLSVQEKVAERCIHEIIAQFASASPNTVAVETKYEKLSYEELNSKADQLAGLLQAEGLKNGSAVAVCASRTEKLIIGMLAIMKIGGVYVPLDPELQSSRIEYIVNDASCDLILVDNKHLEKVESLSKCLVFDSIDFAESNFKPCQIDPNQTAYLIYTSGSTGSPKGVAVSHRAVNHYAIGVNQRVSLEEGASYLSLASVATDLGHTALFGALLAGQTLRFLGEDMALDASALADHLEVRPVSCMKIVPSHLKALMSAYNPARVLPTACLVLGGETPPKALIDEIKELKPDLRIINHYGPTETTVGVLTHEVRDQDVVVPVGKCFPGARIYVLNPAGNQTGFGSVGELYVGGPSLADGYWNRPDQTASSFVPDPFSAEPGGRLYRTGDLVYKRSDGNVVYVGRKDQQVKIRGFRVELGEIEAHISRFDGVKAAVATLQEPDSENARPELVAHIVPSSKTAVDFSGMRAYLLKCLPEYMVPVEYGVLSSLPLANNGKINRKAIPRLDKKSKSLVDYQAPSTELESMLVSLWEELLGCERVGVNDNFFAIGGDSITSIQMAARLNQYGYELMPKQIFESKTIARLAENLNTENRIEIDQGPVVGNVPLTPIQARYFDIHEPSEYSHYNQAVCYELDHCVESAQVENVLNAIFKQHDMLRTKFVKSSGGITQNIEECSEPSMDFRVICYSPDDSEYFDERELVKGMQESLNIFEGQIAKAVLVDRGTDENSRLYLCVHHLVVDGVSWRIISEDLNHGLLQQSKGETIKLQNKTSSFKDWAEHQILRSQSNELEKQHEFWLDQSTKQKLPFDHDAPAHENTFENVDHVSINLNRDMTERLTTVCHEAFGTQINDLLLCALTRAYCSWSGNSEMVVELEGHGRENQNKDLNITRTLGWFTSRYPVKLEYSGTKGSDDLSKLIVQIKETLRSIPENGIGYGLLRYLHEDDHIRQQLHQLATQSISFNYLGQFSQTQRDNILASTREGELPYSINSKHPRSHFLSVNGSIQNSKLGFKLFFCKKLHERVNVERLAESFKESLETIIGHCLKDGVGQATASDFPLANLSQEQFTILTKKYDVNKQTTEDLYPLAPLQHGMIFESQLNPGSGTNMLQLDSTLNGPLNEELWCRIWEEQINRYAIFRTEFIDLDGEVPLQRVAMNVDVPWMIEDWTTLTQEEKSSKYEHLLEQERLFDFDFSNGPLMRFCLIKWSRDITKFVWTRHHALMDGWSSSNVLKEALSSYELQNAGVAHEYQTVVPYSEYIKWLGESSIKDSEEDFWRQYLKGFSKEILLTSDENWKVTNNQEKANVVDVSLPGGLHSRFEQFNKQNGYTAGMVFQLAWGILLSRYSEKSDIVFGSVVSGRPAAISGVESIVGPMINTVPTRIRVNFQRSVHEMMESLSASTSEREDYTVTPLSKIQHYSEVSNGESLFSSLLVIQNFVTKTQRDQINKDVAQSTIKMETTKTSYRMNYPITCFLTLGDETNIKIYYNKGVVSDEVANEFVSSLADIMNYIIDDNVEALSSYTLDCPKPQVKSSMSEGKVIAQDFKKKTQVCVASTYTPEAVADPLDKIFSGLKLDVEINVAGYGQLFHELYSSEGILSENKFGLNVMLLKLDDWRGQSSEENLQKESIQKKSEEFLDALELFKSKSSAKVLVVISPSFNSNCADSYLNSWLAQHQQGLITKLASLPDIQVLEHSQIETWYQVRDFHDTDRDKMAHIPYTEDYLNALAMSIVRSHDALFRAPYKVVVVDCDNTLWKGVCAELGPSNIGLSAPYLKLQSKVVDLANKGYLVCLCSKNEVDDVLEVFSQREDMLLKMDHIVDYKINWDSKSKNINALAESLNLGLDSFIFIDDDPVQCEDVRIGCPTVTVLQIPKIEAEIEKFVDHIWPLDSFQSQGSNAKRLQFYKQEQARIRAKNETKSLSDYLKSLELVVEINDMSKEDTSRVSELVLRTNQFKFTSVKPSESDLIKSLDTSNLSAIVVRVKDRFGDYGLVGCVLYSQCKDTLEVINFMLSCRALSRGVEHAMMREIGKRASEVGSNVTINFTHSEKNTPARKFLEDISQLALDGECDEQHVLHLNCSVLEKLDYQPVQERNEKVHIEKAKAAKGVAHSVDVNMLNRIANKVNTTESLRDLVEVVSNERSDTQRSDIYEAPNGKIENYLSNLWGEILRIDTIGALDNFFRLGGQSLLATRVVSQICKNFSIDITLADFFGVDSLRELSCLIQTKLSERKDKREQYCYSYKDGDHLYSLPNRQMLYKGIHQNHWNMADIYTINDVNKEHLANAVSEILARHEGLRHTFAYLSDGVVDENITPKDKARGLELIDLSGLETIEQRVDELEAYADNLQKCITMAESPYRFVLFDMGSGEPARFLWVIHHSLMDAYSRSLFFGELMTRYLSLCANVEVHMPEFYRADSLSEWAHCIHHLANDDDRVSGAIDYWTSKPLSESTLLADFPSGIADNMSSNKALYGQDISASALLSKEYTEALMDSGWQAQGLGIGDVVYQSFSRALAKITKSNHVYFDVIKSGREPLAGYDVDVSQTIGRFSDYQPVYLDINKNAPLDEQVRSLKKEMASAPSLEFNAIKTLNSDESVRDIFKKLPKAEMLLNFVPPFASSRQQPMGTLAWHQIRPASENVGDLADLEPRDISYGAYVEIRMSGECLSINVMARDNIYTQQTLQHLSGVWKAEIVQTIDIICRQEELIQIA